MNNSFSSSESALLVELLPRYFDRFGDKAVCYEDLLPYIELGGDELAQWNSYLDGLPSLLVSRTLDMVCVLMSQALQIGFRT